MHNPTPDRGRRPAWRTAALLALLILPASAASLAAQEAGAPLTIGALYRAVDSLSPRIAASRAAAAAASARVPGTRRLPDPNLQLATMYRQLPGFDLEPPLGMNQVQLTQMLPIPGTGKLGLAGDVAQARADATATAIGESIWEQRARAAMAFYDLYQADGTLVVMQETRQVLEALSATVSGMYAVGEVRQADVLRAQLEVGRMTGQVVEMGAMRRTMEARLNTVLARPAATPTGVPVLPAFPDTLPPPDSLVTWALASRAMLRAGEDNLRAAEAATTLAEREIWPDLELGVGYGWQPMSGGGTEQMLSVMVGATVPLWAGSRQLKMRDEAAAMRAEAADELEAMRADTRGRVAELAAELDRVRELRAIYARTLLPQAEATVASARSAYQVGNVDFMTLLDAVMTAYDYRAQILRLEAEQGKALAELEMVTGRPLVATVTDPDPVAPGGAP